jgi:hypothetical protein
LSQRTQTALVKATPTGLLCQCNAASQKLDISVFLKGILVMQGKFVQTSFSNMRLLRIKDAISAKLLRWARPSKVHARVQTGHSIHISTNLLALVLDLTLVNLKVSILTQSSSSEAKAWPV